MGEKSVKFANSQNNHSRELGLSPEDARRNLFLGAREAGRFIR